MLYRFLDIQINKLLNVRSLTQAEIVFEAINLYKNEEQGLNSGMDGAVSVNNQDYSIYRTTVNLGQNASAGVSYTSSRVNFLGWFYDQKATVLYSSSENITFQAIEGGVHLYAIFTSDVIDEEWCYHPTSPTYLCSQCNRVNVFFDASDLLDVGYAAVTWYSNQSLVNYAAEGYYTSINKNSNTPIYKVNGNGQASVVDYCEGNQISCGDDAANDGYGNTVNLQVTNTSSVGSSNVAGGISFWQFTGASGGGKVRITTSSTFIGNWSSIGNAACLSTKVTSPALGSVAEEDEDGLTTVQTFHTFFTLNAEIEVTASNSGAGSFKVDQDALNFAVAAGSMTGFIGGNSCSITVRDMSSSDEKTLYTSHANIVNNNGTCTVGTP